MNKDRFMQSLMEKTGRSENECIIINYILEEHGVIGRRSKAKIKKDFVEKLNLTEEEADQLYNLCSETIVKGIFRR